MNTTLRKRWIAPTLVLIVAACGGGGGGDVNPDTNTPPPTTDTVVDTLSFDYTGFTAVEISNSFAFIVQQGERFDIAVEVDREYSDLVSVTRTGDKLTVRFDPMFTGDIRAEVAQGIVTLPVLDRLEVSGSAVVDIAGFDQAYLQTVQSGSSRIEGANSRIDFVDAELNGSSRLYLEHVSPLPAANVVLSGSSRASLGMMTGATLTGSVTGSSNLSYAGGDVIVMVETLGTASVTWLGINSD